jgi:hypothetical protein
MGCKLLPIVFGVSHDRQKILQPLTTLSSMLRTVLIVTKRWPAHRIVHVALDVGLHVRAVPNLRSSRAQ